MLRKIKEFSALAALLLPMSLSAQSGVDATQFGIRPGDEVTVRAVPDEDGNALRSMEARGLRPGAHLTVGDSDERAGTVHLRVGPDRSGAAIVSDTLARRILVAPKEPV